MLFGFTGRIETKCSPTEGVRDLIKLFRCFVCLRQWQNVHQTAAGGNRQVEHGKTNQGISILNLTVEYGSTIDSDAGIVLDDI